MSLREKLHQFLQQYDHELFSNRYSIDETGVLLDEVEGWDMPGVSVALVDRFGGEDEGREYWVVLEFSEANEKVLVRLDADYSSYGGAEYESYCFVKPVPVQRIEYLKE